MLDYKFIQENIDAVKANISARNMDADADLVVELYLLRNKLISNIEELRQQRNENARQMKQKLDNEERKKLISLGQNLKQDIANQEEKLENTQKELDAAAMLIPNMAHPNAPIGLGEEKNIEIERYGNPTEFDFNPLDHLQIAQNLDLIDFETGAKVSGSKFYFLRNQAVFLELALVRYALEILQQHGFVPTITPDIARNSVAEGIGFSPRGEESNIYSLIDTDTCLVGTAEITLGGYYADQILDLSSGPILLAGLSHCFRREAGASGQYSKGLYRVHQFTKVEMFVYCKANESEAMHIKLLEIEKEIFAGLKIPFRVVDTCTGDLGAPAYRKYDLEAWMPGRGEKGDWGEITSASNCTDFQARRLAIRYKEAGKNQFAHTLNGTAMAVSRAIIAILENLQQADGSVKIPDVLIPYCGFESI